MMFLQSQPLQVQEDGAGETVLLYLINAQLAATGPPVLCGH
jgi:hypothetical protein